MKLAFQELIERAIAKGVTKKELAKNLGISTQVVDGWLNGTSEPAPGVQLVIKAWLRDEKGIE